jgi:hypothetical protein
LHQKEDIRVSWGAAMIIQLLIIIISFGLGVFIFLHPMKAIQMQIRFYQKINWKIEPVSMQKEIRNTKIMGLSLIALSLLAGCYLILVR